MKYFVKFKWTDIQNNVQSETKLFNNKQEARKFYNHISEDTRFLKKKYGRNSFYRPYINIEIGELDYGK